MQALGLGGIVGAVSYAVGPFVHACARARVVAEQAAIKQAKVGRCVRRAWVREWVGGRWPQTHLRGSGSGSGCG